jgi:hypothetical protein
MLKNYFLTAIAILENKSFSFINIISLALAWPFAFFNHHIKTPMNTTFHPEVRGYRINTNAIPAKAVAWNMLPPLSGRRYAGFQFSR